MITREEVQTYLQDMAIRISKMRTRSETLISIQFDKLLACADMAKALLDADEVTVDEDWKVTIKGGRS